MKNKAKIEADRLVELYKTKLFPREQFNRFIPDLVKQRTVESAIISANEIQSELERTTPTIQNMSYISSRINHWVQVKQILEEKLK